jgi:hypothetical protein
VLIRRYTLGVDPRKDEVPYGPGAGVPGKLAAGGASTTRRDGGALHSAFSGQSHVDADRPFAGVAFDKTRRPGTQRTFNAPGLKMSLRPSTRTGSRGSPRALAYLAIIPFHDARTKLY